MSKGGRCSSVTALGANLLKIKPCIAVVGGQMIVQKKFRGRLDKCVRDYVIDRLKDRDDIIEDRVFITYSSTTEELRKIVYENLRQYGRFKEILETNAGCTVACHCGPMTLGILFIRKH
jgi:fatty acid-binding protein DegV